MPNQTLVTGANGFIGRRLVQVLSAHNHIVRRCTRNCGEDSDIAVGEIGPDTDWTTAMAGISTVVHLAGRAHILKDMAEYPLAEFFRINAEGVIKLAKHSAHTGVKRFIYISSIAVNGIQSCHPFMDSDTPHPVGPYAISKYEAEQGLFHIAKSSDMKVVIIRPPLVYGPNAPGNFGRLMRVAYQGIPLPLGAINNKRSLVALDNLVDLIVICMDHPAAANQIFLVSDGEDLSTTELLQRIRLSLGRPARLIPVQVGILSFLAKLLGKHDLAQRLFGSLQVDITKTRDLLSWHPPVSVEEALQETAQTFLRQRRS